MGQIVCTDKGILAVEQNKVLVPPAWTKTFAWGYADLSCRLANYESDKVSERVSLSTHCFLALRPFVGELVSYFQKSLELLQYI